MPTLIDLATESLGISPPGTISGSSLSNAGDINGDGFDDFIIGAPGSPDPGKAMAFVIFGKAGGIGDVDFAHLAPDAGFAILTNPADPYGDAGIYVHGGGDINGDGFDDVIVGSNWSRLGGFYSGAAYVLFGKASGFTDVTLTETASPDGFVVVGGALYDQAGEAIASGDINGDGFDDMIFGVRLHDQNGSNSGVVYVVYGGDNGFGTTNLGTLDAGQGFMIGGAAAGNLAGSSVAAGDFNGDGFDDILIGAPDAWYGNSGGAYLILGGPDAIATSMNALSPGEGFHIVGTGQAGVSVAFAGDFNADGFEDIVIGAPGNDSAYVIFGKASGFGTIDLAALAPSDGFRIAGGADDNTGGAVAAAGDVNGDGFDDIIIGSIYGDGTAAGAGNAVVIFGSAAPVGTIDLATFSGKIGFVLQGETANDQTGSSVGAVDIDGDGFSDLLVGAWQYGHAHPPTPGRVWLYQPDQPGSAVTRIGTIAGQTLAGGAMADTLDGQGGDDTLYGNGGDDELTGGDGNDVLRGGAGLDFMKGGAGNDTYYVDNIGDRLSEQPGNGTDRVFASVSYKLSGQYIEDLVLTGTAAISGAGNSLNNHLTGNAAANVLTGFGGNDVLDGGAGADKLVGGAGNDLFIVDNIGDRVLENDGEGTDTVQSSVTFSIAGQYVETLTLTGSTNINGTGSSQANTLNGNSGNNLLNGAAGDDQLHGMSGADTLYGGAGHDGFWFETALGAGNVDAIRDFVAADDTIYLDRAIFVGIAASGELAASAFHAGTAAQDADDRIVYDKATGNIWYDADGSGVGAQILFATVTAHTTLTAADFVAFA